MENQNMGYPQFPQQQGNYQPEYAGPEQPVPVAAVAAEPSYGPRKMSFFTLVLKTLAGFAGGAAGSLVLLLIFLLSSSILEPILGATAQSEVAAGEVSALFMAILMAMVLTTSMISSLLSCLLICYTERDRYTRIATTLSQIFIVNLVIFVFVLPIYLTTSTASLSLTAFAAALQIIMSATASALILELVHDRNYALVAVYSTVLAIMVAAGINFLMFVAFKNATILLFVAQPIIWALIGFAQGAFQMFYFWIFQTWGSDMLVHSATFGADYGVPDESEEEEEPVREDTEGGNFLKQ